jgi:hypothetical protein
MNSEELARIARVTLEHYDQPRERQAWLASSWRR